MSEKFWNDLKIVQEKFASPVITYMHPYTLNLIYKYPYGKSRRGLKKLIRKLERQEKCQIVAIGVKLK